ncbi:MAG: PilZ domain-containing protein [Desulfomonilaceae bacterium]
MKPARKIKAKDVIHDIRSGMNVSDLMAKYRLTINGMRTAFRMLVQGSAMSTDELNELKSLHDVSVHGLRQFPRYPAKFPMKIFDGGDPFKGGLITDISERGVCVQGIQAEIGEVKNFIIRMGPFGANTTIVFEARCCWVKKSLASHKASLAGFEITDISSLDSGVFASFIPG